MDIIFPSDIKIRITSIKDAEGNILQPSDIFLIFHIKDNNGNDYFAISDPEGTETKNTKIEDGYLYVAIENYKLRGNLNWKIGTKVADSVFPDGYWQWFDKFQPMTGPDGKPLTIKYI